MARNTMRLDTSSFTDLITRIESTGGDVRKAVEDALGQAAETIYEDTLRALSNEYLPRKGRYSRGTTRDSVISPREATWEGEVAWVPIGFDFSAPGAGGYLITGTPRMQPDYELLRMYKQKKYMRQIQEEISEVLLDYVIEGIEG